MSCLVELISAVDAIDDVLGVVGVAKARLDPLDQADFTRAVAQLRRELLRVSSGAERVPISRAMRHLLSEDMSNMSEPQITRHVTDSASLLPDVHRTGAVTMPVLSRRGGQMMADTRVSAADEYGLAIGADLAAIDRQVLDRMVTSQGFYVTNAARNRNELWAVTARDVATQGAAQGLGRVEIGRMLRSELGDVLGRDSNYFTVVAAVFLNRARQGSLLSSFDEAGIEQYQFEAVLDEVTTMQCRCLHGKTFSVKTGLQRYASVEQAENPEAVKDIMPWVRSRMVRNDDGTSYQQLFARKSDGSELVVADVSRNAVGARDDRGAFSYEASNASLDKFGVPTPPLHGRCRSTILPVI